LNAGVSIHRGGVEPYTSLLTRYQLLLPVPPCDQCCWDGKYESHVPALTIPSRVTTGSETLVDDEQWRPNHRNKAERIYGLLGLSMARPSVDSLSAAALIFRRTTGYLEVGE